MKILMFILLALILSFLIIIESNNLNLSLKEDSKIFTEKCSDWGKGVYSNLREITGYAVKMEWFPDNPQG